MPRLTEPESESSEPQELDDSDTEAEAARPSEGSKRRRPAPRSFAPGTPDRAGPGRSTLLIALAASFALLSVALAVMVVRFKSDRDDLIADRDRLEDITLTASEVSSALLQFDYRNPNATLPTIERLAATQFLGQYKESVPLLEAAFKPVDAVMGGTIKSIYVADGSSGAEASVIVIADLITTVQVSKEPQQKVAPNTRLELTLALIDGQWKVTNVTNLNVLLANQGPSAETTTTTTTAPAGG